MTEAAGTGVAGEADFKFREMRLFSRCFSYWCAFKPDPYQFQAKMLCPTCFQSTSFEHGPFSVHLPLVYDDGRAAPRSVHMLRSSPL